MKEVWQKNPLMELSAVSDLITSGRKLVLSGDESVLRSLPQGDWIGGTMPYFYLEKEKGRLDKGHVFVTDLTALAENVAISVYSEETLPTVATSGFPNGFHFLILPAFKDIHLSFALHAPDYPELFSNPLIGLVAGADLDEFAVGKTAKVVNGQTGEFLEKEAVVMHIGLSAEKVARLEIINVFEPANEITIEVEEDTLVVGECIVNGEKMRLYDFIQSSGFDITYPLICDYSGAYINAAFQRLNHDKREVVLYGPLFKGKVYTNAKRFENYSAAFRAKATEVLSRESNIVYNCNCILNYLYGELEKHDIGFSGPAAFGEIAYQLVTQTFTYLAIDER